MEVIAASEGLRIAVTVTSSPGNTVNELGERENEIRSGAVTLTVHVAETSPAVAVMIAEVFVFKPVTSPFWSTLTFVEFDEDHVTG